MFARCSASIHQLFPIFASIRSDAFKLTLNREKSRAMPREYFGYMHGHRILRRASERCLSLFCERHGTHVNCVYSFLVLFSLNSVVLLLRNSNMCRIQFSLFCLPILIIIVMISLSFQIVCPFPFDRLVAVYTVHFSVSRLAFFRPTIKSTLCSLSPITQQYNI